MIVEKSKTSLLLLCSMLILSCREKLPVDASNPPPQFSFHFAPGNHFAYDNWLLDNFGRKVLSSRYRNSWTVADTGRTIRGWTRVAIVIDSTFDTSNRFTRTDSLFFRFNDDSDVFQYGFLSSLIAERETLSIAPGWNRIAAFSIPVGTSWVIAVIDTSEGAPSVETVYGRIIQTPEYFGPVTINGTQQAVLTYRIEITKPGLDYIFWFVESPTGVARLVVDSAMNATLRELTAATTR